MKERLVPVLLLALVTMSSSNVVPSFPGKEIDTDTFSLDSQQKDNIFSNKFYNKHSLKYILCKEPMIIPDRYFVTKLCNNLRQNHYDVSDYNDLNRETNINMNHNNEGYRKEQWHNYPSQMDRLDLLLYEYRNENPDIDDVENNGYDIHDNGDPQTGNNKDKTSNDLATENSFKNKYVPGYGDSIASVIPHLILDLKINSMSELQNMPNNLPEKEKSDKEEEVHSFIDESSPIFGTTVAKREYEDVPQDIRFTDDHSPMKTKFVKKRLFSLWSRLQSLSHRGHELQHRRHLYAYYGLPDAEKSGILTAETRATLMRPPGSPLRWG